MSSAIALCIDVGLMWGLVKYSGVNYLLAAAIGFSAGCLANYLISVLFVFDDHSNRKQSVTLVLFTLVGLAGLLINHVVLFVGVDWFNLPLLVAKGVSAGCVFWFNFILRGYLVFKEILTSL